MSLTRNARQILIGLGLSTLLPFSASAEDFARGQELYEHHCNACHSSLAFGGKDREVTSASDLRKRIAGWAVHTGLEWGNGEIDDVLYYLDKSFYHFKDKDS